MTDEHTDDIEDAPSIEEEARRYGWSPRENWRGDDSHWIDAPEFARRAREHLPIVNAALAKERQRVSDLERKQREYDESAQDLRRRLKAQDATHAKMMELQRSEMLQRFETEKRAALAIEDPAHRQQAYDGAVRRESDAVRSLAVAGPPEERREAREPAQLSTEAKSRGDAWLARETWLNDFAVRAAAATIPVPIDFNTDPDGHLEYMKAEMEKRFPGVTGQAPRAATQRPQPVEGAGSRGAARGPKVKGFKELPPEMKSACERMITSRLVKGDPEAFKKSYAENYWKEYDE